MAILFGQKISNDEFIIAFGTECVNRFESSKILPSLPICQAILESGWGTTDVALHGNYHGMNWYNDSVTKGYNHFTYATAPQERNGQIIYQPEEFCEFTNIKDELDCLYKWYNRDKPGYKALHGCTDAYKNFISIKEAGYATGSSYTDSLIRVYNTYPQIKAFDDIVLAEKQTVYRVQVGAFTSRDNAFRYADTLVEQDLGAFVEFSDGLYRVFSGSYIKEESAKKRCDMLAVKGYIAFVAKYEI